MPLIWRYSQFLTRLKKQYSLEHKKYPERGGEGEWGLQLSLFSLNHSTSVHLKKGQTIEMGNCALCNSSDSNVYCQREEYRIRKCIRCGLLYKDPLPTNEALRNHYTDVSDHKYLLKYKHRTVQRGYKILEIVKNLKAGGNLLDVGCGYGFFLNLARERGWKTLGLELSKGAVEYAKESYNLDLLEGDIAETNLEQNYFDLITIQHVLEHILEPILMLKKLAKALTDDGILVVVVPNAYSLMARLAKIHWVCFSEATGHLFQFSNKTLTLLLRLAGIETIKTLTYQWEGRDVLWALKVFLKRLTKPEGNQNSVKRPDEGASDKGAQIIARKPSAYARPISWLVEKLGLGEEILVIARKAKRQ